MKFTLVGAPRTLGNHPRIIKRGSKFIRLAPKTYAAWKKSADAQLPFVKQAATAAGMTLPLMCPVRVCAVFYRDRAIGDCDNFFKGLGDWLQRAGVLANDRQIASWDGSRLEKDATRPRVEIEITEVS